MVEEDASEGGPVPALRAYGPTARRQGKRLFGWFGALVLVALALSVVFLGTPYEGDPASIEAVEEDPSVELTGTNGGYVLEPAAVESDTGIVFYPGGRVRPSAYVGSLAPLASEANVTVVVPSMPRNLAIVDYAVARTGLRPDAASDAMAAHPDIETWYVGGHSLGGAMACRYADRDSDVSGLLLYASYCDVDVSDTGLDVLSVVGTADTVLDWETYERNQQYLPADANLVELDGLNHTQFGTYTSQDDPSGTSYDQAHDRLNDVVIAWLTERRS